MDMPDVIGFKLSDAKTMIEKAGFSIEEIKVALPPRETAVAAEDYFRVLKVKSVGLQKVELIVCKPL